MHTTAPTTIVHTADIEEAEKFKGRFVYNLWRNLPFYPLAIE